MTRTIGQLLWVTAATAAMAACDPDLGEDGGNGGLDERGEVEARGLVNNGFQLNTFRLNTFRLNGQWLGGSNANNVRLVEARFLNGPLITDGWLEGSVLHVKTELDEALSGTQLAGAELVFDVVEDGVLATGKRARIVSVKPLTYGSDVWLYNISLQDSKGVWQPLCMDKGAATEAILLADVWDPVTGERVSPRPSSAVTFACRGAALAKCVEWGYAPWRTHQGAALADYHQACTRAVRADYCGDGTPHTSNGVGIHVKDPLGIQQEDNSKPHVVEAEWGSNGALCLNEDNTRLPDAVVACDLPACDASWIGKGKLQTAKLTGG